MIKNFLSKLAPWKFIKLFGVVATKAIEEPPLAPQNVKVANHTTAYEATIRELWEDTKQDPTEENIVEFIAAMVGASEEVWEEMYMDVLDLEDLLPHHREHMERELANHKQYLTASLLPDLLEAIKNDEIDLNRFDHRVIFLYAGALWSSGMLATVMFDGLDFRDLGDLFLFAGPNDEATCTGERGCDQYANKVFTVAQILKDDIIPGHLRCVHNCRHMLIPIASPLNE